MGKKSLHRRRGIGGEGGGVVVRVGLELQPGEGVYGGRRGGNQELCAISSHPLM